MLPPSWQEVRGLREVARVILASWRVAMRERDRWASNYLDGVTRVAGGTLLRDTGGREGAGAGEIYR